MCRFVDRIMAAYDEQDFPLTGPLDLNKLRDGFEQEFELDTDQIDEYGKIAHNVESLLLWLKLEMAYILLFFMVRMYLGSC